ncbi:MAG TPA: hypothetical protein VEL31_21005 [Ktedonobacteraceae bacterium]|nr:hypothetical protein [Ktedonobacteraceae bacterium]
MLGSSLHQHPTVLHLSYSQLTPSAGASMVSACGEVSWETVSSQVLSHTDGGISRAEMTELATHDPTSQPRSNH